MTSSTLPRAYGYISSHSRNEGFPVYENSQPNPPPLPNLGIEVAVVSNFLKIGLFGDNHIQGANPSSVARGGAMGHLQPQGITAKH